MKILKPSNREKKRYLLITGKDADKKIIENVILEFIGVLGYAKSCPQFIKNDKGIVLSIDRKALDNVRSSFLMSQKDINIKKVSSTIKKLE